jgi:hypothetical protein
VVRARPRPIGPSILPYTRIAAEKKFGARIAANIAKLLELLERPQD